jgi:hypothetical protein
MDARRCGRDPRPLATRLVSSRDLPKKNRRQRRKSATEIVEALGTVPFNPRSFDLQLYQQRLLDHQNDKIPTDHDSIIRDREPALRNSCAGASSYTLSRNPVPSVLLTFNAQPMPRPDRIGGYS